MVNNDSITQINQIFTIHNNFLRVSKNPETKKLGKLKTDVHQNIRTHSFSNHTFKPERPGHVVMSQPQHK